jgi:leucyl-tRNA synthetase
MSEAYTEYGRLVDSGAYTGLLPNKREKMNADAKAKGFGEAQTTYRLKDWGVLASATGARRFRWSTARRTRIVAVPDDQLPVRLPENVTLTGKGQSPLAGVPEFVNVTCPKCGGPGAARDGHDGYVRRFVVVFLPLHRSAQRSKRLSTSRSAEYWFPIDQYIGGVEHAILHLIYSRFFCKVMRDIGLVESSTSR